MPIATSPTASSHPATLVKMEDRKRPAFNAVDDLAPPSKRQAVNGGSKAKDDSGDMKEEAWIEEYQKGAIFRQMLEYKREKTNLETRLQELEKSTVDHDDHIRIIDAWLLQFLQEVELLAEGAFTSTSTAEDHAPAFSSSFKDSKDFQRHLGDKAKTAKERFDKLFAQIAAVRGKIDPEISKLEQQIKLLLANQKESAVELDRLKAENASLSEQYDKATLKVVKAERKLDRARSAQVQKLEQQALASATRQPTSAEETSGSNDMNNGNNEELKIQLDEAVAAVAKQKEQIESLLTEVKTLQEENSTFKTKKDSISEEDYARTDVFKQFRAQNEDLIKRVNNLEAVNKQYREEAEKLQAERTAFRAQLEKEAQAVVQELELDNQQKDQDLTRIRAARDELHAEVAMRKASQDQEKTAAAHLQELMDAKADRIAELESELERLRPSEDTEMTTPRSDLEALSVDELRQKYAKLEKDFEAINKEMPLLEKSYKKAMGLAQKRVLDFQALEDKVGLLTAEKAKADQKYFAVRRDLDTRTNENKVLRGQNLKSSDIIAQLREVQNQKGTLMNSLEQQLAQLRQSNASLNLEYKKLDALNGQTSKRADLINKQLTDMKGLVNSKEADKIALKEEAMAHETDLEKLKKRLEHVAKDRDNWKIKSQSNSSSEEEMLRKLVMCSVCKNNIKNTVLKTCGHVLCNECIDSRIANRMRKCPNCNKAFDRSDAMTVHL
ncbi:BRE1-domain-containing protein [Thozetella sp. PMI_491]|nr:BRE1-domain-containing protein [Thozetella sp. PMI_491]